MERLTEKYDGVIWLDGKKHYIMKQNGCFDSYRKDKEDVVDKLGQLEDIEEELGIELSVLFKAMKCCYYKTHTKLGIVKGTLCCIGRTYKFQGKDTECLIAYKRGSMFVKLCDYGKTWALTKEELEK